MIREKAGDAPVYFFVFWEVLLLGEGISLSNALTKSAPTKRVSRISVDSSAANLKRSLAFAIDLFDTRLGACMS